MLYSIFIKLITHNSLLSLIPSSEMFKYNYLTILSKVNSWLDHPVFTFCVYIILIFYILLCTFSLLFFHIHNHALITFCIATFIFRKI